MSEKGVTFLLFGSRVYVMLTVFLDVNPLEIRTIIIVFKDRSGIPMNLSCRLAFPNVLTERLGFHLFSCRMVFPN